jgi:hypothetical protein
VPKAPSISLTKLIEATKLHPRTGLSLGQPPVTVPYGALVEPVSAERDRQRFKYLGELYECGSDLFQSASGGGGSAAGPAMETAPPPAAEKTAAPVAAAGPRLEWERLRSSDHAVTRASVPGGWLVTVGGTGVTFVPDPKHRWDGASAK